MTEIDWPRQIQRVTVAESSELDWEWATSLPYRCLADPRRAMVMPAAPREDETHDDKNFNQRLAYYTALQSFLTYSFGWTRQDKGLNWWRKRDFAALDERFALIRAVWHRDDTLFGYFAWTTTVDPHLATRPLAPWVRELDLRPLNLDPDTAGTVRSALRRPPWTGGSDPLHLGGGDHGGSPSGATAEPLSAEAAHLKPRIIDLDHGSRRALYVSERIDGWYAGLIEAGRELPNLPNDRNWRVDVFVREIGFVGTYRRSRQTGLWFAGRHEFHTAGN